MADPQLFCLWRKVILSRLLSALEGRARFRPDEDRTRVRRRARDETRRTYPRVIFSAKKRIVRRSTFDVRRSTFAERIRRPPTPCETVSSPDSGSRAPIRTHRRARDASTLRVRTSRRLSRRARNPKTPRAIGPTPRSVSTPRRRRRRSRAAPTGGARPAAPVPSGRHPPRRRPSAAIGRIPPCAAARLPPFRRRYPPRRRNRVRGFRRSRRRSARWRLRRGALRVGVPRRGVLRVGVHRGEERRRRRRHRLVVASAPALRRQRRRHARIRPEVRGAPTPATPNGDGFTPYAPPAGIPLAAPRRIGARGGVVGEAARHCRRAPRDARGTFATVAAPGAPNAPRGARSAARFASGLVVVAFGICPGNSAAAAAAGSAALASAPPPASLARRWTSRRPTSKRQPPGSHLAGPTAR